MRDFLTAALPWVLIGIAIAVFAAGAAVGAKKKRERQANGETAEPGNYATEGMCLGLALELLFGSTGVVRLETGIGMGMLLGLAVGGFIPKPKE